MAACSATAGHSRTPIVCDRMPKAARIRTAPMLYSSIVVTNPLAARLCVSPRASQQATPSETNPAPPTRATVKAADASSGAPTRSTAAADGKHSSARPAPISMFAVVANRMFIGEGPLAFFELVPMRISVRLRRDLDRTFLVSTAHLRASGNCGRPRVSCANPHARSCDRLPV